MPRYEVPFLQALVLLLSTVGMRLTLGMHTFPPFLLFSSFPSSRQGHRQTDRRWDAPKISLDRLA